jgi:hypothetical protein
MAVFANSGQICCAGTRLFVEHKIYDEFVGRVAEFSKTFQVGDGRDPDTQVGPLVSREQHLTASPATWRSGGRKAPIRFPAARVSPRVPWREASSFHRPSSRMFVTI